MKISITLALTASVALASCKKFLDNCVNGPVRWNEQPNVSNPDVFDGCDGVDPNLCYLA